MKHGVYIHNIYYHKQVKAHSTTQMKQSLLHAEDKHIHRHRVLSTYQHLQKIHSIHHIKTSNGFFDLWMPNFATECQCYMKCQTQKVTNLQHFSQITENASLLFKISCCC